MEAQVSKKIITKEVLTKVEEEVTTVTLTLSLDEAKLLRTSAYAVAIYGAVKNGSVCNLMWDIHKGLIASGVPACERIYQVVDQVKYSGKK